MAKHADVEFRADGFISFHPHYKKLRLRCRLASREGGATHTTYRSNSMPDVYDDAEEQARHLDAIAALAEETRQPISHVKRVYEAEFTRLKADARIRDYLVLLASRRARDALLRPREA